MSASTNATSSRGPLAWMLVAGVTFAASYFVSVFALKLGEWEPPARLALALFPVAPCAWFVWSELRLLRGLDELQRRIHLEALAIGYPVAILFAMTLGLLQREGFVPHALRDLRDVWGFLPWPYFVALFFVRRRYV